MEKFLNDVIVEVLGETHSKEDVERHVINEIQYHKTLINKLSEFRSKVVENLGLECSASAKGVWNKCSVVAHFRRLFQVKNDEIQAMEGLMWFVHEVNQFLKDARKALDVPEDESVAKLLQNILCRIRNRI